MTNKRGEEVIKILHNNWDKIIIDNDIKDWHKVKESIIKGLIAQVYRNCQGWDASAEDYTDEIGQILGWDGLDGHDDRWLDIVNDAAIKWLAIHAGTKYVKIFELWDITNRDNWPKIGDMFRVGYNVGMCIDRDIDYEGTSAVFWMLMEVE